MKAINEEIILSLDPAVSVDFCGLSVLKFNGHDRFNLPKINAMSFARWSGVPYLQIADRIQKIDRKLGKMGARRTVVVDQSGPGAALVEILRDRGVGQQLVGITITASDSFQYVPQEDSYRVGKIPLLTALAAAVESGRLTLENHPLAETLLHEVRSLRATILPSGRMKAEVPQSSHDLAHDDLLMATAQGIWTAGQIWTPDGIDWLRSVQSSRIAADLSDLDDPPERDLTEDAMKPRKVDVMSAMNQAYSLKKGF